MHNDERDHLLIFLARSKLRRVVLEALAHEAVIASFLAKKLNRHRASISRILKDLTAHGLAYCTNKTAPHFRRYTITKKGIKILSIYDREFGA